MNTTDLLTDIQGRLANVTARSYYQQAPQTTTLPYIVWDITAGDMYIDDSKRNDYTLTVDIWANNDDVATLETLADSVAGIDLDKEIETNITVYYNLINKLNIPTGEENLRRRQLIFTVKNYYI